MANDIVARALAIKATEGLTTKADLVDGKIPLGQLPDSLDDVREVASYNDLPKKGTIGVIYVTLDSNQIYRWSGSQYILISSQDIPTKVSELENDAGYLSEIPSEYITENELASYAKLSDLPVVPTKTSDLINDSGFTTTTYVDNTLDNKLSSFNIENGTGTNAVQMKQEVSTIDYTGRNPNATTIDSTITGTIEIGAKGAQSATFGKQTTAMNLNALAEGNKTIAKGEESHAEGYQSVALGDGSHAEGHVTVSSGTCAHSEGNNTIASGEISHAEGFTTQAIGEGAHAEGAHTVARGNYSHAGGLNTEANHDGQTVVGHCNDNKETTVFEVGCGWKDENGNVVQKQNAFEVYKDGHAEVKIIGSTDNSVATKLYVDSNGGTKFYKHSIRSSNIATDKQIVIINTSSYNVSASTPSTLAGMAFISGYITNYPEGSAAPKYTILYKGGPNFVVYDHDTSTFTHYSATGTITDTVEEL